MTRTLRGSGRPRVEPNKKEIMTSDQMLLLRMSFVTVMDRKAEAGRVFYDHLFTIAPELRVLFKGDMNAQAHKFIEMLAIVVGLLSNPTALSQTLTQLSHRHRGYSVHDKHFDYVGDALLLTLADILGEEFTPELKTTWRDLYNMVATAMKRSSPSPVDV
jgi:hemoglobin-like flavoprotein